MNPDDVADMRKTIIEWEGNDIREVMQTVQAVAAERAGLRDDALSWRTR